MDDKYQEMLKVKGVKNTKHRQALLELLEHSPVPLTAEDIFIELKDQSSINLSTVYRSLDILTSKGLVIKSNVVDDGKSRYELNLNEHKHHVFCIGCNRLIAIEECPVEEFEHTLKQKIDFDVTSHKLEIYGYCRDCKKN